MSEKKRKSKDWVLGEVTKKHDTRVVGHGRVSNQLVMGVTFHASMGQETRTWRSSAGWQMPGWEGANEPAQVAKILRELADELDQTFEVGEK